MHAVGGTDAIFWIFLFIFFFNGSLFKTYGGSQDKNSMVLFLLTMIPCELIMKISVFKLYVPFFSMVSLKK